MAMTAPGRSFSAFVKARYRRLLPAFVVCAAITFAIEALVPESISHRGQGAQHLVMTLACIPTFDIPCEILYQLGRRLDQYWEYAFVDGAYWSLLVEFRFYALFAAAYYAILRIKPDAVRYVWMPLLLCSLIALTPPNFGQGRIGDFAQYLPFFTFGMGAYQWRRGDILGLVAMAASASLVVALCLLSIPFMSVRFAPEQIATFVALLAAFALVARPDFRLPAPINGSTLFVAGISYPLYLLHQDIGLIAISAFGAVGWLVALAVVVPLAVGVHFFVERPVQKMRRPSLNLSPTVIT